MTGGGGRGEGGRTACNGWRAASLSASVFPRDVRAACALRSASCSGPRAVARRRADSSAHSCGAAGRRMPAPSRHALSILACLQGASAATILLSRPAPSPGGTSSGRKAPRASPARRLHPAGTADSLLVHSPGLLLVQAGGWPTAAPWRTRLPQKEGSPVSGKVRPAKFSGKKNRHQTHAQTSTL